MTTNNAFTHRIPITDKFLAYAVPLLDDGSNFEEWKYHLEQLFVTKSCSEVFEKDFVFPASNSTDPTDVAKHQKVKVANQLVRSFIPYSLSYALSSFPPENPKSLFDFIVSRYENSKAQKLSSLLHQYSNLRYDAYSSPNDYELAALTIRNKLTQYPEHKSLCSDEILIHKTLNSVPADMVPLATALTAVNFKSFSDLIRKLNECSLTKHGQTSSVPKVNSFQNTVGHNDATATVSYVKRSTERRSCVRCGDFGHIAMDCEANAEKIDKYREKCKARKAGEERGRSHERQRHHRRGYHTSAEHKNISGNRHKDRSRERSHSFDSRSRSRDHKNRSYSRDRKYKPNQYRPKSPKRHAYTNFEANFTDTTEPFNNRYFEINPETHMVEIDIGKPDNNIFAETNTIIVKDSVFLLDSGTTHSIINDIKFMTDIVFSSFKIRTVTDKHGTKIEQGGIGTATIQLPNGHHLILPNTLYSPNFKRNLISASQLRLQNYHLRTLDHIHGFGLYLPGANILSPPTEIFIFANYLYCLTGKPITKRPCPFPSADVTHVQKIPRTELSRHGSKPAQQENLFKLYHDRLGHPSISTLRIAIKNNVFTDLPLTTKHFPNSTLNHNRPCVPCAQGKKHRKPFFSHASSTKPINNAIWMDWKGPITPPSGPYKYVLCIMDSSGARRRGYVRFGTKRSEYYALALVTLLQIRTQYFDFPIQKLHLDNALEFRSSRFDAYCQSQGIQLEYGPAYEKEMNGTSENYVKQVTNVARTLLCQSSLPGYMWRHAFEHAAALLNLWPTQALGGDSSEQLLLGRPPSISHLRKFGCTIYVPVHHAKAMEPRRSKGIYIGFTSPSVCKVLSIEGQVYTARFADCIFDEFEFPALVNSQRGTNIMYEFDEQLPQVTQMEVNADVENVFQLHESIACKIPDQNVRLERPHSQQLVEGDGPALSRRSWGSQDAAQPRRRRGRPPVVSGTPGSFVHTELPNPARKPRKPKTTQTVSVIDDNLNETIQLRTELTDANPPSAPSPSSAPPSNHILPPNPPIEEPPVTTTAPTEGQQLKTMIRLKIPKPTESFEINFLASDDTNQKIIPRSTIHLDENFVTRMDLIADCFAVFNYKPNNSKLSKPKRTFTDDELSIPPRTLQEAMARPDRLKWIEACSREASSIDKRKVFSAPLNVPESATFVGHKWVFDFKRNEHGEIILYKARLVAQGFTQKFGTDYDMTYNPVLDYVTFRLLIFLSLFWNVDMCLVDVVTAFLYGDLDKEIYIRIPEGYKTPSHLSRPGFRLNKALYGLKQSGRSWFTKLSSFLSSNGFTTSIITPCLFFRIFPNTNDFVLLAIYVDDINLIGTNTGINFAKDILQHEFNIKDLGLTSYCLGQTLYRLPRFSFPSLSSSSSLIILHQASYTQRILKKFNMWDSNPRPTPLYVRNLNPTKDIYGPPRENEDLLPPTYPYLSAIGALLYLATCTRPDISFSVSLLSRYSATPTMRHWKGVQHIFRYLRGTVSLGLQYSPVRQGGVDELIQGYADAGFRSDFSSMKSQTGYVFLINGTAFSWRSVKQTMIAESSSESEMIALYEAVREAVFLKNLTNVTFSSVGKVNPFTKPIPIYEDNRQAFLHATQGFARTDRNKHINPKICSINSHHGKEVEIRKIPTEENPADLFTKILPRIKHEKFVKMIGMAKAPIKTQE